jgi:hypothetical protein
MDISKCFGSDKEKGIDCTLKESCLRYTAKSDDYLQAYFTQVPFHDGKCNHLININRRKNE